MLLSVLFLYMLGVFIYVFQIFLGEETWRRIGESPAQ